MQDLQSNELISYFYDFRLDGTPLVYDPKQPVSSKFTAVFPTRLSFTTDIALRNATATSNMFEVELRDANNNTIRSWDYGEIALDINPACTPQGEAKAYQVIEGPRPGLFRVYLLCTIKTSFGGLIKIKVGETAIDATVNFVVLAGEVSRADSIFTGAVLPDSK